MAPVVGSWKLTVNVALSLQVGQTTAKPLEVVNIILWMNNLVVRIPTQHSETSLGSQLQIPGLPDVVSTIFNPIDVMGEVSDGGVKWYNNNTGMTTRSYRIFDGSGGNPQPLFSKANGIGDLAALCPLVPLEIGNRVWLDSNGNGIQDAGELGIDGVAVDLYQDGVLIGSTITANGGQYYFNNSNVHTVNGILAGTGTPGGNSAYEIRIPNAVGATQQATLANLNPTGAHQDLTTNANLRDSDGVLNGVNVSYAIPYADLVGAGNNNHTYDFGFSTVVPTTPVADLEILKTVTPGAYVQGVATDVTFFFTVTNHGPSDVPNATVTDNEPVGVTFTSWSCAIGAAGSGTVINACGAAGGSGSIATTVALRNGATAIFTIHATIGTSAIGVVVNEASEGLPAEVTQNPNQNLLDSSSASLTPQGVVDLEIVKTVTPNVYAQGTNTNVTFVFTVTNHGPSDVAGAAVTDNEPANVVFNSWSCAIGAAGLGTVTNACGIPNGNRSIASTVTLRNGATAIFTVNATVNSVATGVVVNTASETLPVGMTQNPNQNLPDTSAVSLTPTALASLGDFVWFDTNKNGIQDGGEPGARRRDRHPVQWRRPPTSQSGDHRHGPVSVHQPNAGRLQSLLYPTRWGCVHPGQSGEQ